MLGRLVGGLVSDDAWLLQDQISQGPCWKGGAEMKGMMRRKHCFICASWATSVRACARLHHSCAGAPPSANANLRILTCALI